MLKFIKRFIATFLVIFGTISAIEAGAVLAEGPRLF